MLLACRNLKEQVEIGKFEGSIHKTSSFIPETIYKVLIFTEQSALPAVRCIHTIEENILPQFYLMVYELFAARDDIPTHFVVLMVFCVSEALVLEELGIPPAEALGLLLFVDIALILCQSLAFSC